MTSMPGLEKRQQKIRGQTPLQFLSKRKHMGYWIFWDTPWVFFPQFSSYHPGLLHFLLGFRGSLEKTPEAWGEWSNLTEHLHMFHGGCMHLASQHLLGKIWLRTLNIASLSLWTWDIFTKSFLIFSKQVLQQCSTWRIIPVDVSGWYSWW